MRSRKVYSDQFKQDIIIRYQQSGLSICNFCQLPDVSVSIRSINRWLKSYSVRNTHSKQRPAQTPPLENLNIVCYSIEDDDVKDATTLEEMIKFRNDVHNCCVHLYQMGCNKKNIALLSQIVGAL